MKKCKTSDPYHFKDHTHQEIVDILNKDLPLNLKYNENLIDKIYNKYPLISKSQISIIVKATFQGIRDLLILGKILNFNKIFFDTKLLVFPYRRKDVIFPSLKVKISTPPPLREYD